MAVLCGGPLALRPCLQMCWKSALEHSARCRHRVVDIRSMNTTPRALREWRARNTLTDGGGCPRMRCRS